MTEVKTLPRKYGAFRVAAEGILRPKLYLGNTTHSAYGGGDPDITSGIRRIPLCGGGDPQHRGGSREGGCSWGSCTRPEHK